MADLYDVIIAGGEKVGAFLSGLVAADDDHIFDRHALHLRFAVECADVAGIFDELSARHTFIDDDVGGVLDDRFALGGEGLSVFVDGFFRWRRRLFASG